MNDNKERDFQRQGGIDFLVSQAVEAGIDPDAARAVLEDEASWTSHDTIREQTGQDA